MIKALTKLFELGSEVADVLFWLGLFVIFFCFAAMLVVSAIAVGFVLLA